MPTYVDPPAHAVVRSIDEKCQIQALDRAQSRLPLKPGRCGTMTDMQHRARSSIARAARAGCTRKAGALCDTAADAAATLDEFGAGPLDAVRFVEWRGAFAPATRPALPRAAQAAAPGWSRASPMTRRRRWPGRMRRCTPRRVPRSLGGLSGRRDQTHAALDTVIL